MKYNVLLFVVMLFLLPSLVLASELVLKDGRAVDGKIIEQTAKYIKIDIDGGLGRMTYYSDEIDTVDGQKSQAPALPTTAVEPVAQPIQTDQQDEIKSNNDLQVSKLQESSNNNTVAYNDALEKADEYYKQGNTDGAIDEYSKAIDLVPNNGKVYALRGRVYEDQDKWGQAISDLSMAIKLNFKYAPIYDIRGKAYGVQGDWTKALDDLNKAIELNPTDGDYYALRGAINANLGNFPQAISDFSKAIEINPNLAIAYRDRGRAYAHEKEYDKALSDALKAKDLGSAVDPKFIDSLKNRQGSWKNIILYIISSLLVFLTIWVSPRKMIWGFFKSSD